MPLAQRCLPIWVRTQKPSFPFEKIIMNEWHNKYDKSDKSEHQQHVKFAHKHTYTYVLAHARLWACNRAHTMHTCAHTTHLSPRT